MTNNLTQKAGIALVLGAVISIFRVLPIVLSNGVTGDNFPPESLEDVIFFSQLQGWHISHVLILVLIPLLIFGTGILARDAAAKNQASAGLMALIGTTLSMILFSVATVLDGFVLPAVTRDIGAAGGAGEAQTGTLALFTHEAASIFGGTASAFLLITALFIGIALMRGFNAQWLGGLGIALGALSALGYLTGFLNLNISDGFTRVGPLLMLSFFYLLAVGIAMLRQANLTTT